jgi:anthranilate phosphoribosyltransferase
MKSVKINPPYISLTSSLQKLMRRENLSAEEAKRAFATILKEDREGYFITAFLTAMSTKGETGEELYGLYQALSEFCPKLEVGIDSDKITDLSGTGGSKLKTINVSTAASFVVAAAGFKVAKQAFPGITSPTGSADVFRAFGIDVFKINREKIKMALNEIGIVPYNTAFGLAEKWEAIRKFGEINIKYLNIVNPLHVMINIFSPIPMKRRIYGVFSDKYLESLVDLLQRLGYKKGMVFYGLDGLCEISNIGPTKIIEFEGTKRKEYIVMPEDFGIKKARYEDIKAISPEQNIKDFVRILLGKEKGPKRDMVLLNAAASLYVMDGVKDMKEGVEVARKLIEEGKAWEKLEKLVFLLGDPGKLKVWEEKI